MLKYHRHISWNQNSLQGDLYNQHIMDVFIFMFFIVLQVSFQHVSVSHISSKINHEYNLRGK